MKNLQLYRIRRTPVNIVNRKAKHIVYVNNKVYVLLNNDLMVYEDGPGEVVASSKSSATDIVQFDFLPLENVIWIASKWLFQYVDLNDNNSLQKITFANNEGLTIETAEWNPRKQEFAAITVTGDLYVFHVDFSMQLAIEISSCRLRDVFIPGPEPLGWGSAERQFRSPQELAEIQALEGEEGIIDVDVATKISWSSNSKQLAVNVYSEGIRKLRIYSFRCLLLYESEDILGLQSVIAWRPTGSGIAGVIWTSKRCQIAIFENNGLLFATYNLTKTAYVEQLKWSICGYILAVQQYPNDDLPTTIDLYSINNNQMHLKQRLQFLDVNPLVGFEFLNNPLPTLFLLRVTTLYEAITYTFNLVYDSSQVASRTYTTCAVIDGAKAYLTTCTIGMKPPPDCDYIAEVQRPINFVTFHPSEPWIALIDCCNEITLFKLADDGLTKLFSYVLKGEPGFLAPLKFYHFAWLLPRIFCVGEKMSPHSNEVDAYDLTLSVQQNTPTTFTVKTMFDNGINFKGYMEFDHKTAEIVQKGGVIPCTTRAVTHLHMRTVVNKSNVYVFSLTSGNKFFINNLEVLQGVNSFIVNDEYAFFTNEAGELLTIRIQPDVIAEITQKNLNNVYVRKIEVGAALICTIPDTPCVALEMSRGNIEFCSCRIVAIDIIEKCIKQQDWKKALYIVRMEKLNLNVLVDLNFFRFTESIGNFLKGLETPSNISEFLLTLEDSNIFNGAYKNCSIRVEHEGSNKRNIICGLIVNVLEEENYKHFINPIITACFVKNSPAAINEALEYVQGLLDRIDDDASFMEAAVEAFKSARVLKPSRDIFETALLTYDLDLIMFVGRNLEMDPIEYEPFVDSLKGLEPCRCRFQINDFLGRHFEAFQYLLRATHEDREVLEYIDLNNIYNQAVWCIKPTTALYTEVCRFIARSFSRNGKYQEAGIFFSRANLPKQALEAYTTGLFWRQASEIMNQLHLDQAEISTHFRSIALNLTLVGRAEEASKIYEKYLSDYEMAIKVCIDGKLFPRAIRIVKKYNRKDIYVSDILGGVAAHAVLMNHTFNDMIQQYNIQKTRLLALRAEKKQKFESEDNFEFTVDDVELGGGDDVRSIISSSTLQTSATTSTGMSTRSRRRQMRKLHSTREGSMYEDIALIEQLYKLIHEAFDFGPKAKELCMIMLESRVPPNPHPTVITMCNTLVNLQGQMKIGLQEIWPPNMNNVDATPVDAAIYKNLNMLDSKFRFPPENVMTTWKIDAFPTFEVEEES